MHGSRAAINGGRMVDGHTGVNQPRRQRGTPARTRKARGTSSLGKAGGLKKVEPLKAVDVVNRSKAVRL